MNRVSDIGARTLDELKARVGHRLDMDIVDYRVAGGKLAVISIAYDHRAGEPSASDISDFVVRGFGGKIVPHMGTCRLHAHANAVTMQVTAAQICRPAEDKKRMAHVGGNRYLEASTKEVWEIEDNEGTPALYRVAEEDLNSILHAKYRTSTRTASTIAMLNSLRGDGAAMAMPGANVLFFSQNGDETVGKVMGAPDEHGWVPVVVTGEESVTKIHRDQIVEVVTSPELDVNTKAMLKEYYAKAFGDSEYAQQLVSGSVTGRKEDLLAFLVDTNVMDPSSAIAWVNTLRMTPQKVFKAKHVLAEYNGTGYTWEVDIDEVK